MSKRISVFLNGDNLYAFQKKNFWVDPQAILDWVNNQIGPVADAYYYLSCLPQNTKQMTFVRALEHFGYITRAKKGKRYEFENDDGSGEVEYEFEKANLEVDFVCDLLTTQAVYNTAVLICPSKDALRPIELIKASGKSVIVVGPTIYTSKDIIDTVGPRNFIDLSSIEEHIIRK
jgi:uncharacterized LabA/DUF88 family protein